MGDEDFRQIEKIIHTGAMIIRTLDNFTCGNPEDFKKNINKHFRKKNKLFFIEKTGHTYQQKEQEIAEILLKYLQKNIKKNLLQKNFQVGDNFLV